MTQAQAPTLPKKVLLLGSGALQIGQAGEFDYSGSQAIKACKAQGIEVVVINPNIATNQTSQALADRVYFLPVTPEYVEKVIQKESPDAIMLAWGGQTALNCGIQLHDAGIFQKYDIRVLGTPVETIRMTEDRKAFNDALESIGKKYPRSHACYNEEEARTALKDLGFPVIVRAAFALGGGGSGFAENQEEFEALIGNAFSGSPQILVEESLRGWKEIEYEVVRDANGNCITVCNMENFDPLGVHTGESIVIAPSQTLRDEEYQMLRTVAQEVVSHLGVVGECNIQYALDPNSQEYRIIEVNARLSRSSALASKATGYPLAAVAAEIALGKTLPEIKNPITGTTSAMFEPALDYIAVKIPRWDLNKFRKVNTILGSEMKSVGEVMALGRSFPEALQKGLRMLQIGALGISHHPAFDDHKWSEEERNDELRKPTPRRVFVAYEALKNGATPEQIHEMSGIDLWFLQQIQRIEKMEQELSASSLEEISQAMMREAKKLGYADAQMEKIWGEETSEEAIRLKRISMGIRPVLKQIDTLAAEFPAQTNYCYYTYHGDKNDIALREKSSEKTVLVLGGGPYSIGSSVEFDWCCVTAVHKLASKGYETIMLNSNPETVSTDYEECDLLVFDELSLERVLDVIDHFSPEGTILATGGQVPNNLAPKLGRAGVPILGTAPEDIDRAEDRQKFAQMCDDLGIDQPAWQEFTSVTEANAFATEVGYPVLVRPSKVLSGAAMAVAHNTQELEAFIAKASKVGSDAPIVVSKFEMNAREIELDGVGHKGELILHAISEHVENAGVHSGDATIVLPPQKTYLETIRRIKIAAKKLCKALNITGPFNIQFLAKENMIKVIELNLRASRSFPFVSKVTGINFIEVATRAALGDVDPLPERRNKYRTLDLPYVGVKAAQFSFSRLRGADPVLSVEMASTGEVGCFGRSFAQALLLSQIAIGFVAPKKGVLLSVGPQKAKHDIVESAKIYASMGLKIYATPGTAKVLRENDIAVNEVPKAHKEASQEQSPTILRILRSREIDLVINIPRTSAHEEHTDGYRIRRAAVDAKVPLMTNLQLSQAITRALSEVSTDNLPVIAWDEYLAEL